MSGSSTQVSRLLALVPYLLGHPGSRVAEVAASFGVSKAQLRKDLEVLQWCGLPGLRYGDYIEIDLEAVDGQGVINLSNADYFARPLRFTADEAVALLLALRSLRDVADPEQVTVIDTAIDKLETVAGAVAAVADRTAVRISAGDEEIRLAVHHALRAGHQLRITYDVAARAETTHRTVDPLRASVRDGNAYLDAWCHLAGGLRSFRMDRIVAAEELDAAVEPHPEVTLPDPAADWFADQGEAPVVTLALQPRGRWVVEYYPTFQPDDPGQETVDARASSSERRGSSSERSERVETADPVEVAQFRVADPAWLRSLLLRLGDAVQVLAPAAADQPARKAAEEALEQYRALGL